MEFTLRFLKPSLPFGVERGDLIVLQPAVAPPYTCLASRPVPLNYGGMVAAVQSGTARLLTPGDMSLAGFIAELRADEQVRYTTLDGGSPRRVGG